MNIVNICPRFMSYRRRYVVLLSTVGFIGWSCLSTSLLALDATWNGSSSTSWNTTANWTPANIPGINTTDTATFNIAIPGSGRGGDSDPINTNMPENRAIKNILFDTSSVGAFVFGTTSGSTLYLRARDPNASITMNSAVENSQTFNAPINLFNGGAAHSYSFINNASSSSARLLINGNITSLLSNANSNTLTLGGTNTGTNTISGNISGTSGATSYNMVKNDAGTWVLSGANTMHLTSSSTIQTTINAGMLQLAKTVALYNGDTTKWTDSSVNVKSGATLALNVGGAGEFDAADVATLAALGGATSGFEGGSKLGLDTTNAAGGNFTYNTAITDTNAGANALGLRKLGTNTLTLTVANTYTGGTSIEQGTLALTQNFTMSGENSFVILDTASSVAGVDYAQLTFSGTTLTYGGSLDIAFNEALASGTIYDLISFTSGSGSGDFSSITISGYYESSLLQSGNLWTGVADGWNFSFDQVSGDLTVSAVPEPAAMAAMMGGVVFLSIVFIRRRQRMNR